MLKIENVSYKYKGSDRNVLKNLNITFESGKLSTIVGASGSGKTTLLSLMAGLDTPTEGAIQINGKALSALNLDEYRSKHVSMIFQAFQLFPLLTAIENVCFPMECNGVSKKDAQKQAVTFLESVGIDKTKHKRYPSNLSGGEQQRVAIARALATGAKVLLADEPTGNLDVDNGNAVIDLLKNIAHKDGYCVIIVTHDLDIAETSDVVYRMSDGVLV